MAARGQLKKRKASKASAPAGKPPPFAAPTVREMSADEFVRRLHEDAIDKRFALFLGAGCSVSSGIPEAARLVNERWLPRLRDLRAPDRSDLDEWGKASVPGYDPNNPAASYGELINLLFLNAEERQREIESLCDGRTPSFGYAVLAQLVAAPAGRFNVVLTTNFDDMVADALYLYTEARPLVIQHESLAAFIRPTRTRPLVVKLHGDHRLSPRNTALETAQLEEEIQRHTAMVLHDRGIIFMGYGGEDHGIYKLLDELPAEALPYGAYWVHPKPPVGAIRAWLGRRGGIWVRGGWFDEVMLLIRNAFELPHPDEGRFARVFTDYRGRFEELSARIRSKPITGEDAKALNDALTETEDSFPVAWKIVYGALQLQATAPEAAYEVYRGAVELFPTFHPGLHNYALYLSTIRKDFDAAEPIFQRAIDADPKSGPSLSNYAYFLETIRHDYAGADAMYKRSLDVDPSASGFGAYAVFLQRVRKDPDASEAAFKRALETDPADAATLANYAYFLDTVREDADAAEAMYKRAIEAEHSVDTGLSNYARFLWGTRQDSAAADAMYKRALAADPKSARYYASFLEHALKDLDSADAMYKRGVDADPRDADRLGEYARFLERRDANAAEAMYRRAIEAGQRHAKNLCRYAVFRWFVRKDGDAADAMFRRAVEADDAGAEIRGNYAIFLQDARKDSDAAEVMFKRALEAEPKHAACLYNYAVFLKFIRKDCDLADATYRRAVEADSKMRFRLDSNSNFQVMRV